LGSAFLQRHQHVNLLCLVALRLVQVVQVLQCALLSGSIGADLLGHLDDRRLALPFWSLSIDSWQ